MVGTGFGETLEHQIGDRGVRFEVPVNTVGVTAPAHDLVTDGEVPDGGEFASARDEGITIGGTGALVFGGEPITTPFVLWEGVFAHSDEELRRYSRTAPVRPLKPRLNRPWRKK